MGQNTNKFVQSNARSTNSGPEIASSDNPFRGSGARNASQAASKIVLGRIHHGDELILIGGAPRSGTTLIQNMLDMHNNIIGGPEFLHFPDVIKLRQELFTSISRGWLDVYCSYEDVDNSLRLFVDSLIKPVRRGQKARIISEKTPQNVLAFSGLAALFPGARFIHIVRDPRAIVASLLQVYKRAREKGITVYPEYTTNVSSAIRYTKKCMDAGIEASREFQDRIYTVCYEKLVRHPEAETKKMCDFLGINWEPNLLRPSGQKHLGEKPITDNSGQIWYDRKGYYRDPDLRSIEKWKDTLSVTQQVMVTEAFAHCEGLAQLGYALNVEQYPFAARVLARGVMLADKIFRRLQRIVRIQ